MAPPDSFPDSASMLSKQFILAGSPGSNNTAKARRLVDLYFSVCVGRCALGGCLSFQAEVITAHAQKSRTLGLQAPSTWCVRDRKCYIPGASWLVLGPALSKQGGRPVSLEDATVPMKAPWLENSLWIPGALIHKCCTKRLFVMAAVVSAQTPI